MRDHGSIGLFLGNGFLFLLGILALNVFGLFLFCFCLVHGEKVASAQDLGWQSKGEDHFRSWSPFFLLGDNFVLFRYCLVLRLFSIFLLIFFRGQGLTFSPWVKVYGKLVFWLKACRTAGHDICQGLVRFKDKRGCPTLFLWHKCNNDDLEILCKTNHACTYVDTQASCFYGHVTLGLRIYFPYFKSTRYFQNIFFYQFMHSSESILGVRENFHCIHPSGAYTFFFKILVFWMASSFPFKSMLAF